MKQEGVEVDFQSWKWISLRHRRRFVFILLNAALCAMWTSLFLSRYYHYRHHTNSVFDLFIHSTVSVILTLHTIVLVLSVCDSRLQSIIEYNDRLGKGLVHAVVFSLLLVVLFGVGVNSSESSNLFELSFTSAAVTLIFPRLLHNMGYSKNQIAFYFGLFSVPWGILWLRYDMSDVGSNFWIMLVSAMSFCFVDIYIQESEYQYHFEALKSSIKTKVKEQNFDFQDIIASVDTVVDMINQLEFDIRYRISRGLEYYCTSNLGDDVNNLEREKRVILNEGEGLGKGMISPFPIETSNPSPYRSGIKVGSASLKAHHQGYLYQIETLCEAIAISLNRDNSAFGDDKNGSFYLSEMMENVFLSFEDTFLPRVVPLFFDSAFGDLYFQKTSRKCLETLVFLILYDSIYGKNPGFCSVSFQCQKHGGIGHNKKVQLVISKYSNSSPLLTQKKTTSHDASTSDKHKSHSKHITRNFASTYSDSPQILLADRLAFHYLNTRVYGSGPHQNGDLSTHTWRLDISSIQTQQHDERIPLLCDLKEDLCQWILFHDSACASADLHIYQRFKNTLTKLGVSFIVGDIQSGTDGQNRQSKHKICVIHERILNMQSEKKLQLLVAKAANILILVDVEVERRDASFFGARHFRPQFQLNGAAAISPSFEKRTLPEDFCRLVRMQMYSNVTAAEFIKQFKEFRVEPKSVEVVAPSPPVISGTPKTSVRMHSSSTRFVPTTEPIYDKELVYLSAVGVTVSISSCWHQMLQDWKIDPNGYPKLLQLLQLHYGSELQEYDRDKRSSELRNIESDEENSEEVNAASNVLDRVASTSEDVTRSVSNSSWRSRIDNSSDRCSLDMLKSIVLCQPQQRQLEYLEKNLAMLLLHPCLTVHTIEKIIKNAKIECLPKEVPLHDNFSDDVVSNASKTYANKSLLTIVNHSAYASSGGGIVYSYFSKRFIKPLNKLRVWLNVLEQSCKEEVITKSVLEDLSLRGIHNGLNDLIDQCMRDDLAFLCTWFGCIQTMLSENLRKTRIEVLKMIPMMLDIAENIMWGVSDCC